MSEETYLNKDIKQMFLNFHGCPGGARAVRGAGRLGENFGNSWFSVRVNAASHMHTHPSRLPQRFSPNSQACETSDGEV